MYETRLEMAAGWLWDHRRGLRVSGEPVAMAYCYQPEDVTQPIESELLRVINAVDTYDSVRSVIRVDMRRVKDVTFKLYKTFNPDAQYVPDSVLKELEGAIKLMLLDLKVEGDIPYDLPAEQEKD